MTEDLQTRAETPAGDAGLRRGVMGGGELAAQAIANIAPSAVIAFTAAAIYTSAGNGTWVSFALATVVILSVATASRSSPSAAPARARCTATPRPPWDRSAPT
ncbi:amino acid permease [Mycolicibacterium conceptionense]|uniref:Amino acid permease n=1 Tax=Mycolicibacterium conceptionense TaxID=451644 RepID=A0A0U1D5C1_9MYCO|nr:amino acid permease [Mycolicibacterium conceptionense]